MGQRTLQYHTKQITHEITAISKLVGFVVPLGLAVGWCAAPAMGDGAVMELIGLPSSSVASAGAQFKFDDDVVAGDTMPIPK